VIGVSVSGFTSCKKLTKRSLPLMFVTHRCRFAISSISKAQSKLVCSLAKSNIQVRLMSTEHGSHIDNVLNILQEVKPETETPITTSKPSQQRKNRLVNNSKLESLCKAGKIDKALKAFVSMQERNQESLPNFTSYKILRDGLNQILVSKEEQLHTNPKMNTLSKLHFIVVSLDQCIAKIEHLAQKIDTKVNSIDDKLFLLLESHQRKEKQRQTEKKTK